MLGNSVVAGKLNLRVSDNVAGVMDTDNLIKEVHNCNRGNCNATESRIFLYCAELIYMLVILFMLLKSLTFSRETFLDGSICWK